MKITAAILTIVIGVIGCNNRSVFQALSDDDSQGEPFIIGTWEGPPAFWINGQVWPGWSNLRKAGFNLLGPMRPRGDRLTTLQYDYKKILDDIQRLNMSNPENPLRVVVADPEIIMGTVTDWDRKMKQLTDKFFGHPAFAYLYLIDEPSPGDFSWLHSASRALGDHDKKNRSYINLFPSHALPRQIGRDYDTYLENFISRANPSQLSFDHYPLLDDPVKTESWIYGKYFHNLEIIVAKAKKYKLPPWIFVQLKGFRDRRVVSKSDLFWQTNVALASGFKGISYFHMMNLDGLNGGILDLGGQPVEPHFSEVTEVNQNFLRVSSELRDFSHIKTYHGSKPSLPVGTEVIPNNHHLIAPGQNVVLGEFHSRGGDGIIINMIVNRSLDAELKLPLTFDLGLNVSRFSFTENKWVKMQYEGTTLSIGPGECQLLKFLDKR